MDKICYVTTTSGFLPQFEMNDVDIVKSLGYQVHYASNFNNPIYTYEKNLLEDKGIVKHHLDIAKSPLKLRTNIRSIKQLMRVIDEEEIKLIHCHNPLGGVVARIAAHFSKSKPYVIYTAHGFHFYKGAPVINWLFYYTTELFLARWTDVIITINEEDYLLAKRKFHLKENGYVAQIHGVGLDMERFKPIPSYKERKRAELGISLKTYHIVTTAELNDNKNQSVIVEALSKLKGQNICYSICGEGPGRQKLEALIAEKGLEDQVKLLGFRTDMEEILQTADVFAFPSKREGLGMAAVEALSCGIPVIAANNRGTREYMKEDVNGFLCNAKDIEGFKDAIIKAKGDWGQNPERGKLCRDSVKGFNTSETMRRMRVIYENARK